MFKLLFLILVIYILGVGATNNILTLNTLQNRTDCTSNCTCNDKSEYDKYIFVNTNTANLWEDGVCLAYC